MSRHVSFALLLVAVVFGLGIALRDWVWPLHETPAQPTLIPSAKPTAPRGMTVTALRGNVERLQAAGTHWEPLTSVAELRSNDALRTSEGARAVVSAGDELHVELSEKSEFRLSTMAHDLSRILLENGHLAAEVKGGRTHLQVAIKGNDAVVEGSDAAFAVMRTHDARVSVVTTQGRVGVRTQRDRVEVAAGNQTVVPPHGPPAPPSKIPASLFLKVTRAGPARINRRHTEVDGTTTPGAEISVNGVQVSPDDRGQFKAHVALHEGKNTLEVKAVDALGRVRSQTLPPVHVDTKAPKLVGEVVW